jgi:hypothetical protein
VPVTSDPQRRVAVIAREWQRIDPSRLAGDEQEMWARLAGRQVRIEERQAFAEKLARASRECRELFLMACAAENPNRRLRLAALGDRVATTVSRSDYDDLVTIVSSSPVWEKDRVQGVRILLRAIGADKIDVPEDILSRWTWKLARTARKVQDRRASAEFAEAKRLLGTLANSRRHRHEENAARLVNVALEQPINVAAALLASAEGYTPTAQELISRARERIGTIQEVANALADNLPQPKANSSKRRRRKRRKKKSKAGNAQPGSQANGAPNGQATTSGGKPPATETQASGNKNKQAPKSANGKAEPPAGSSSGEAGDPAGAARPPSAQSGKAGGGGGSSRRRRSGRNRGSRGSGPRNTSKE